MIHFIHKTLNLKGIISRFIFWMIVLVVFTSFSFLFTYSAIDRQLKSKEAKETLSYGLSNQKITLENWEQDRENELRLLASLPDIDQQELEAMAKKFRYLQDHFPQTNAIVYADKDGNVLVDTGFDGQLIQDEHINISDRDYFVAAKAGEEMGFRILQKPSTGDEAVLFSTPILDGQSTFKGLIFIAVRLEEIMELLKETLQGKTGRISLANQEGELIFQITQGLEESFVAQASTERLDGDLLHYMHKHDKPGFMEYKNEEDTAVYAVFEQVLDGKFILINEIEKQEILAPHNRIVLTMFIVTLVLVIGVLLIVYPVTLRLLEPFRHIWLAIDRVKGGDYRTKVELDKFRDSPQELQALIHVFNEMTAAIQDNKQLLKRLSHTDGLTKVANRRLFEEYLGKSWQQALEEREVLSLFFIDIDYFKDYNDSFGHQAGDQSLIQVAQALNRVAASNEQFLARYGGEEFVIIAAKLTSEEALQLAEEIQKEIRHLGIRRSTAEPSKLVTVSIGIARMRAHSWQAQEELVQKADQALYEAKSAGRNTIIMKDLT